MCGTTNICHKTLVSVTGKISDEIIIRQIISFLVARNRTTVICL